MITLVVGYPRTLPVRRDVISQPIPGTLHPRPSALHLTVWPLSGRPELRQAFLKGCGRCCPQPTGFYPRGVHSRLAGFFSWCESQGVDPRSAPLTDVAVFWAPFLIRVAWFSKIRGYRSAIAAIHTGFPDGSCVPTAPSLTGWVRVSF